MTKAGQKVVKRSLKGRSGLGGDLEHFWGIFRARRARTQNIVDARDG